MKIYKYFVFAAIVFALIAGACGTTVPGGSEGIILAPAATDFARMATPNPTEQLEQMPERQKIVQYMASFATPTLVPSGCIPVFAPKANKTKAGAAAGTWQAKDNTTGYYNATMGWKNSPDGTYRTPDAKKAEKYAVVANNEGFFRVDEHIRILIDGKAAWVLETNGSWCEIH